MTWRVRSSPRNPSEVVAVETALHVEAVLALMRLVANPADAAAFRTAARAMHGGAARLDQETIDAVEVTIEATHAGLQKQLSAFQTTCEMARALATTTTTRTTRRRRASRVETRGALASAARRREGGRERGGGEIDDTVVTSRVVPRTSRVA